MKMKDLDQHAVQKLKAVKKAVSQAQHCSGIFITHNFTGQRCNNCLQAFKAFKLALMMGVPLRNVILDKCAYKPFFIRIKQNFIAGEDIRKHQFTDCAYADWKKLEELAKTPQSIRLAKQHWLYPRTLEDLCLMAFMLDGNDDLKAKAVLHNPDAFIKDAGKALVGLTVRRTDFLRVPSKYDVKSPEHVQSLIDDIRTKHNGHVKIFISSDNITQVKSELKDLRNVIFSNSQDANEDLIAQSLCDYVISNGNWHRCADRATPAHHYESTFGQIAQILNVSRKFLASTEYNIDYFKSKY